MIKHNQPCLGQKEIEAVTNVLNSKWIMSGEKTKEFEDEFSKYIGCESVAVSSGTAALYLALKCLGIKGEVITTTYVCSAVLNAIYMVGCKPILCDISKHDFNISLEEVEKTINQKTKAIIIPHAFGAPANIDAFRKFGIPIIEDACQALGSEINNRKCGSFGDLSIFSFGASKMITTGNGGAVCSNNKRYIDKIRDFIDYDCHDRYSKKFNFQTNDILSSLGLVQLKRLPIFLYKRTQMAYEYHDICKSRGWDCNKGMITGNNFYRFVLIIDFVDRLKQHLADNDITAIVPIRQDELLHNMVGLNMANFENAEYVAEHSLSLPIFPDLLDEEFSRILEVLRRF